MSEDKSALAPSNRPREASCSDALIFAATFGCLVGLIDFALFELWGHPSRVLDYVLYKPTFISFSSLLIHTTLVIAISWLLVFGLIALRLISRRLTGKFVGFFPLAALSVALTGLLVVSLRFLKESASISRTVVLLTSIALLSAISFALERRFANSTPGVNRVMGAAQTAMLAFSIAVLAMVFLAPDLHTLFRAGGTPPAEKRQQRPNVMLIVLDTVRADRLSCYGNTTLATPNIDELARGGLLFLNAFSTAPWTVPSHASMFTGLYPSQHQAAWDNTRLRDEFVTLAERLTESGYASAGFSENPFVGIANGFAQGFDEFHETWRRPLLERAVIKALRALGRRYDLEYAPRTTSLLSGWLETRRSDRRPYFAFVNLMAAHLPRYPRSGYDSTDWTHAVLAKIEPLNIVPERYYLPKYRLNESELRVMAEIYDAEVSYLDDYVGRILDSLDEFKIIDDTIIILTSDHGESFGEHGFIEHQFCLYNTLIHIPLIIRFPQAIEPAVVHEMVSSVAIMDTILDLASISPDDVSERDPHIPLNSTMENQTIVAEYPNAVGMLRVEIGHEAPKFDYTPFDRDLRCIIRGDYKYIWSSDGNDELYSISDDFAEEKNLLQSQEETAGELRHVLDQWCQTHQPRPHPGAAPAIDAATRDALKALGYEH